MQTTLNEVFLILVIASLVTFIFASIFITFKVVVLLNDKRSFKKLIPIMPEETFTEINYPKTISNLLISCYQGHTDPDTILNIAANMRSFGRNEIVKLFTQGYCLEWASMIHDYLPETTDILYSNRMHHYFIRCQNRYFDITGEIFFQSSIPDDQIVGCDQKEFAKVS